MIRARGRRAARRRRASLAAIATTLVEAGFLWTRSRKPAGNVVVRCRRGHLSTTIWIPGVSVKSLRLGPWRVQRCPVGPHWSLVTPVREASLSEADRRVASERRDVRIP